MTRIIVCLIFLFFPWPAISAGRDAKWEPTMCLEYEEVYFSCLSRGKIVSVCAAGNISPENGSVNYRFGEEGYEEISVPSESYPPRKGVLLSDVGRKGLEIIFKEREYRYVVFVGNVKGVYVKRYGKVIARHVCDSGGIYQSVNSRLFRGLYMIDPGSGVED